MRADILRDQGPHIVRGEGVVDSSALVDHAEGNILPFTVGMGINAAHPLVPSPQCPVKRELRHGLLGPFVFPAVIIGIRHKIHPVPNLERPAQTVGSDVVLGRHLRLDDLELPRGH